MGKQHLLLAGQPERPVLDDDNYGVDWSVSGYDGLHKPTLTLRYLFTGTAHTEVRSYETFSYDNGSRLTNAKHMYTLNGVGVSVPTFTLSNLNYNYKDQLTRRNIANVAGKYLQSVDYAYNGRGWLTNIGSVNETGNDYPIFSNGPDYSAYGSGTYPTTFSLPTPKSGEDNPDLFTESITYDGPDYTIPGAQASQYNGNISQIVWQVAGREKQAYSFKYDNLERLIEANYADIHNSTYSYHGWPAQFKTDNKFQEKVSYDLRGNIQSLQRNGLTANTMTYNGFVSGNFGQIDNLTYTYDPTDKNKLTKVTDAADLTKGFTSVNNAAATHYTYDANGNLITDVNKGITNIKYNYLNLPLEITFTGNRTLQFIYDATGVKLQKIVNNNGTITNQHYVNGIEYNGTTLERIPHTEGEIVQNGSGGYVYEYTLKDHLGNTRVTFGDADNNGVVENSDIKQINHYYPFGLNMEGPGFGVQGVNKYQYNQKELNSDFGLNWNDYGARWYDATDCRWLGVDNLASFFHNESPYNYVSNNPIKYIDVQGMFRIDAYFAKRYPNLTTVIASYLPLLKDNPEIIQAFTEVTGFSKAQFVEMVKFGSGPWVTPTRPDMFVMGNPPPYQEVSQYEPNGFENNLFLNGKSLQEIENQITQALGSNNGKSLSTNIFVMSIMILHEAAHYAHYKTYGEGQGRHKDIRWGGTDKGFDFFRKAFGTDFTTPSFVDDAFDKNQARSYAANHEGQTGLFGLASQGNSFDKWIWDILRTVNKGLKGDPTQTPSDKKDTKPFPAPKPPCKCFGN